MTDWTNFRVAQDDDRLWRVTFDNPPINLVTPEMLTELPKLLDEMEASAELRVVVFDSANPDFFLDHYDTSRVAETPTAKEASGYPPQTDISVRLSRIPVISIAKIRGRVRGVGNEFSLAMDMRFAGDRALFGQPETANGNLPGGGGLEHLPRLMGRSRALEVALSAEDYPADLAERYGWVNRTLPDADLDLVVDELARRIASFDKQSLQAVKDQIGRYTLPSPEELTSSMDLYMASFGWAGSKRRLPIATAAGRNQAGDYEMRLGYHLGHQPEAAS